MKLESARPNQAAALPVRLHAQGFVEVMLVTARRSGRWIIPKGWLEPGLAPYEVAAKEAEEEAGLIGEVDRQPFGSFIYDKRLPSGMVVPCHVMVHLLPAPGQLAQWREQDQRRCLWLGSREAARLICNLTLRRLVQKIGRQPERLRRLPYRRAAAAPPDIPPQPAALPSHFPLTTRPI